MGLLDDFKDRYSSLLNRDMTPALVVVLAEIKSKEDAQTGKGIIYNGLNYPSATSLQLIASLIKIEDETFLITIVFIIDNEVSSIADKYRFEGGGRIAILLPSGLFHVLLLHHFWAPFIGKPFLRQSAGYHSIPCNSSLCNSLDKLDLGASFSWVDCTQNNTSTTYHSIPCNSFPFNSLDKLACSNCFDSPGLGYSNDSCALFPENSATRTVLLAQALVDTLALPLSDGRNPGRLGLVREFVISCSKTPLLKGFPKGTTSLGRSNFSLPA
ncbi:hypothetical protein RJ640_002384 [Escallonia rubra]|uniref:Xylanase inhibitor N-terminal domain-containing protein n=1 Tax=Escallonia rubra TaxID=112253 RepID=A0AA88RET7_9ASTE|nr:hypothetical protein RJ640_002384 [Escallonia rubra]